MAYPTFDLSHSYLKDASEVTTTLVRSEIGRIYETINVGR